jgi:hypothetical protein
VDAAFCVDENPGVDLFVLCCSVEIAFYDLRALYLEVPRDGVLYPLSVRVEVAEVRLHDVVLYAVQ